MATLRLMSAGDLNAILTIQRESPAAAQWPAEEWRVFYGAREATESEQLRAGYYAWVWDENGVVGFVAALFTGEELEILNVAVAPEMRRKGVAASLLGCALAAARKSRARRAFLEVRESNAEAIAFYERQGFLPAGARKDYYREPVENALVLARTI